MKSKKTKKPRRKKSLDSSDFAPIVATDTQDSSTENDLLVDLQVPRYAIFRRVINKKIEPDQSTLPSIPHKKSNIQEEEKKFSIYQFNHKKSDYMITPDSKLIEPLHEKNYIHTNGVEHDLFFNQSTLGKLLSPQATQSFLEEKLEYSLTGSALSLRKGRIDVEIKKATRGLFESILKPSETEEDNPFYVRDAPIKGPTMTSYPAPTFPNFPQTNLFNFEISQFEYQKLLNPHPFFSVDYTFHRRVKLCPEKQSSKNFGKYILKNEDLKLDSGEFVLVEYIDDDPVIQPIVGMCSTLTVLTSDSNITSHKFDQRIPLMNIVSESQQPFLGNIPKSDPVICLLNQVAISAVYPHDMSHNMTDFILCISGNSCTLHRLPKLVYASTPSECRVIIKNTTYHSKVLDPFLTKRGVNPIELCKARSIYKAKKRLVDMGIDRSALPSSFSENNLKSLIKDFPIEMRTLIMHYISIFKHTPWYISHLTARARLGMLKAASEISFEEGKIAQVKEAMAQSFENRIAMISTSNTPLDQRNSIGLDLLDFSDGMDESSDSEDWETILKEDQIDEFREKTSNLEYKSFRSLVNWNELIKTRHEWREVMLTRNYYVEDGVAKCSFSFTRDSNEIKQAKALKKSTKNSFI